LVGKNRPSKKSAVFWTCKQANNGTILQLLQNRSAAFRKAGHNVAVLFGMAYTLVRCVGYIAKVFDSDFGMTRCRIAMLDI